MDKKEQIFHDWMIEYLAERLSRDFNDIKINVTGMKKHDFKGCFPDLILGNYGVTLAVMEVETAHSIDPEKISQWKTLSNLGVKLIIMIPKDLKSKVMDILWKEALVSKVSLGTYDLNINIP